MTELLESAQDYNEDSFQALTGLQPVRQRPGMYIGSTGKQGLHHLLWEVVDNCVDEAMAGFADRIWVTLNEDNSITVTDNGRGIPVTPQTKGPYKGMPTVEMAMTVLHAGGKFEGSAYGFSGGLHGVGVSVVNALSKNMSTEVSRDGHIHRIDFAYSSEAIDGEVITVPGKVSEPLRVIGDTDETGTKINFLPDEDVFSTVSWDVRLIERRLRNNAFLNAGLTVSLQDDRNPNDPSYVEYCYPNGLLDYMDLLTKGRLSEWQETRESDEEYATLLEHPVRLEGHDNEGSEWEIYLNWYPDNWYRHYSYANGIETVDGGTHVDGFQLALTQMLNKFARQEYIGVLRDKDPNFEASDVRSGLGAIISVKVMEAQFEGQTKSKLGNEFVKSMVRTGFYDSMWKWMEEHPAEITVVLEKIASEMRMRRKLADIAERERNNAEQRGTTATGSTGRLPRKLVDAESRDRSNCELFIVEGKSASGTAKSGRISRATQGVLPIRGKIRNIENAIRSRNRMIEKGEYDPKKDQVLNNDEVQQIIASLGAGSEDLYDGTKLRYDKVIILTDADDDGAHIQILLMTMFYHMLRQYVEDGHLYVARPPLYSGRYKEKGSFHKVYASSIEERMEVEEKHPNTTWTRFKGLAEMNPTQLRETAMDPDTRRIVQINFDETSGQVINDLLGNNSDRKWDVLSAMEISEDEVANLT